MRYHYPYKHISYVAIMAEVPQLKKKSSRNDLLSTPRTSEAFKIILYFQNHLLATKYLKMAFPYDNHCSVITVIL